MLDVRRLKVLREVARQGSFSAAADVLSYTQSAVSQQIAALERETGTVLVDRTRRGIRLTDAGAALVEHAEGIFASLAAAQEEIEAIAGLRGGRLRLASFPTAGATLVPLAVADFTRRHPQVELSLVEAEPEESLPRLRAGDLEVALVFDYPDLPRARGESLHDGVELVPLLEDPMYLALPRGHRLAQRARVRLEDAADELWVEGNPAGLCGAMHRNACHSAGFEPRVGFESDDYNVVQGLVAAGVGLSLLPMLALTNVREDIVVRSLGSQTPVRRVSAAVAAGSYRSPATAAMLEVLQSTGARYAEDQSAARVLAAAPAQAGAA
jgi:DNA-binding transcriptional LysR family regulator